MYFDLYKFNFSVLLSNQDIVLFITVYNIRTFKKSESVVFILNRNIRIISKPHC